jgi:hypothetical protein
VLKPAYDNHSDAAQKALKRLFLRASLLFAILVIPQDGELALVVLRELQSSRPRLGEELRLRLRKDCVRAAIVIFDQQMVALGRYFSRVMRELVGPGISP